MSDPLKDDHFQGARRAGYGEREARLNKLLEWLERHPDSTLYSGEGRLLLEEIRRLEALLARCCNPD